MNSDTYLQGYICSLKTLYSRGDEVDKLMLNHDVTINHTCTYIHMHAGYVTLLNFYTLEYRMAQMFDSAKF